MTRSLAAGLVLAGLALGLVPATGGCSSLEASAKRDPLKCERDAKCDKKRTRTFDCSTQCVDDPACMDRCLQVQQQNGGLGH